MSIIRVKKEQKYAIINNAVLNDADLTWEARGIMAYLLSKPNGWECRNYDLVNQGPAGKHIIQRVIKELQGAGYVYRYQVSDGYIIEWVTEIYESPQLNTTSRNTDSPHAEEPTGGRAEGRKPGHIVSTDSNNDLPKENTDLNGSAKNSQSSSFVNQLDEANEKLNDYSPEKKADLNILVPYLASLSDIQVKAELRGVALLGFELARVCKLEISLTSITNLKTIARVTLGLNTKNVIQSDLNDYETWWYTHNWKGKREQAPTPGDLGDTWGQFEAQKVARPSIDISKDGFYV